MWSLTDEDVETILLDSRSDLSNAFILDHEPEYLADLTPARGAERLNSMSNPKLHMHTLSTTANSLHWKRMFITKDGYICIADHTIFHGDLFL